MNRPMTKQEWLSYIEQTWDAAQKEAWSEQPRRWWVGLTEEEIKILWIQYRAALPRYLCFALAIEAALREKNT